MALSSEAIIGIGIGVGVLVLNVCLGVAWFLLRRRNQQRTTKHPEELDTSRPLVSAWQPVSPTIPPTSPTSPTSPSGVRQSYQSLLMALMMRPVSRLPTPASEKSSSGLDEPLMPVAFSFEPISPNKPRRSTDSTPLTSDSSAPPTPELPPASIPAGSPAAAAEAVKMRVGEPAAAAPQPQYPFLAEPATLPSRPSSRVWRAPTKKSAKSARSSLRRRGSWDTASMYSVASAPISQHDALLVASLEDLVWAPPNSAPAWVRYDEGRVADDLSSIAEMSNDGSMRSSSVFHASPPQVLSQTAITPLPSPPQPSMAPPSPQVWPARRPSVRALPSPPIQHTPFASNPTSPTLDGRPISPPGLYTVAEDNDVPLLSPSFTRTSPSQLSAAHPLPPPPRARSVDDIHPALAASGRPASHHALPTPPTTTATTTDRPLSAPGPAVPARSPYRHIDGLPRTLLAGPYASRPTRA